MTIPLTDTFSAIGNQGEFSYQAPVDFEAQLNYDTHASCLYLCSKTGAKSPVQIRRTPL